jgi:hypothetical protein
MSSGRLTIVIVAVFVLANGVAAAIYFATRDESASGPDVTALAEAAKLEGLRAMQDRRYDDAARELERAIALGDGSQSTRELLATVRLERDRAAATTPVEAPPVGATADEEEPPPHEAPEAPTVEREVEADEEADARMISARERRLYEIRRTREREEEQEIEEPPPPEEPPEPPAPIEPPPPPAMAEPPAPVVRAQTTPMAEPRVQTSMTAQPAPELPSSTEVGELEVLTSDVEGDVFVNGRRYGRAPTIVRHIPAGRARVEIRVGGRVVSATTVTVRARERRSVLLR